MKGSVQNLYKTWQPMITYFEKMKSLQIIIKRFLETGLNMITNVAWFYIYVKTTINMSEN